MTLLIVDYGMGNIASARRSFEECGAKVLVSADPHSIESANRVVIPGVGAFAEAMGRLDSRGWTVALRTAVGERIPVLGICLGMQLLAQEGEEGGRVSGLGFVPGRVVRLQPRSGERVPHVGWNQVYAGEQQSLFRGIPAGCDFYFVHSYHFVVSDPAFALATTPYCGGVVAAVQRDNVYGVQFHPEKSSRAGFRLIKNFLAA